MDVLGRSHAVGTHKRALALASILLLLLYSPPIMSSQPAAGQSTAEIHQTVGKPADTSSGPHGIIHRVSDAALPARPLAPAKSCIATNGTSKLTDAIIFVNTTCRWDQTTLSGNVGGAVSGAQGVSFTNLTIEGGGTVNVKTPWNITAYGILTVEGGSRLIFSPADTLNMSRSSSSLDILPYSALLLNGTPLHLVPSVGGAKGGNIIVDEATLEGQRMLQPPLQPASGVSSINLTGTLNRLEIHGSPVGSTVQWVNLTGSVHNVDIEGSSPFSNISISGLNAYNASITTFHADNATIASTTLGSVGNVTLGNASAKLTDIVNVKSLQFKAKVSGMFELAHARVAQLVFGGAANVTIVNSTMQSGSSGITDVSSTFSATSGCQFLFPLVFNNVRNVHLQNVTSPSLTFNGNTSAVVYNWKVSTVVSGGFGEIPNIQVNNQSARVQVYRFVSIQVVVAGGSVPPSSTTVSTMDTLVPNAPTVRYSLPSSGVIGLFLLSDNLTSGRDSFVGNYAITVTAPGLSASSSLSLTSDDMQVRFQLVPQPPASSYAEYMFIGEILALGAVVGATVYLIVLIRRESPKNKEPAPDGTSP